MFLEIELMSGNHMNEKTLKRMLNLFIRYIEDLDHLRFSSGYIKHIIETQNIAVLKYFIDKKMPNKYLDNIIF